MSDPFELTDEPEIAPPETANPRADAPVAPVSYLQGLNEPQVEAVQAIDGPVLVLAGAGTGKTRVLTTRLAHILMNQMARPWEIVAVTFTNKAAKEMQNRVSKILGSSAVGLSWLGTFHSICAKLLRKHASAANLNYNFTIIDIDDQTRLIKNICKAENIDIKQLAPRYILAIIDRWKNKGFYPNEVIINKKDIYENEDIFTLQIKIKGRVVAQKMFSGNDYPPKVRYDVDIRSIISEIISKIQNGLSLENYTQEYCGYTL
mgnify:CR=1 FL=1